MYGRWFYTSSPPNLQAVKLKDVASLWQVIVPPSSPSNSHIPRPALYPASHIPHTPSPMSPLYSLHYPYSLSIAFDFAPTVCAPFITPLNLVHCIRAVSWNRVHGCFFTELERYEGIEIDVAGWACVFDEVSITHWMFVIQSLRKFWQRGNNRSGGVLIDSEVEEGEECTG